MNVINKTTARLTLLVTVLLLGVSNVSYGVIAYPGPIEVIQPDGSILTIRAHGDEFFNYNTTEDGYIIAKNEEGYFCYADYDTGKLRVSNVRVGKGSSIGKAKNIPESVLKMLHENGQRRFHEPQKSGAGYGVYSPNYTKEHIKQGIIILVEYTDVKFHSPSANQDFSNLANQIGYSANGGTGSIADFYSDNSMGVYRPKFDVVGPYQIPNTRAYYAAGNSANRGDIQAVDAIKAADADVDFSQYSSDGATIDLVLIYYAGHNAAERGQGVWPHKYTVSSHNLTVDGVKAAEYACTSELRGSSGSSMAGIGTMTHEFGHALGLADVYSVGNTSNLAVTSWRYLDVMNAGNYNNEGRTPPLLTAYERAQIGWLQFEDIDASQLYTLPPLFTSNKAYRIKTDVDGEFYTFENRNTGTNNRWDTPIGPTAKGMIVYHMDYSTTNVFYSAAYPGNISAATAWSVNIPNSAPLHLCADLVEPSGSDSPGQLHPSLFFPGSLGVSSLGSNAIQAPKIATWSTVNVGVDLTDIKLTGQDVTFTVKSAQIDFQKAQVSGSVKSVMEVPIAGAEIKVYDAAAGSSSTALFSTTTDSKGLYSLINLNVDKNYLMVASKAPLYLSAEVTRKFNKGVNTQDFKTVLSDTNPDKNVMKWYDTDNGSVAHGVSGDLYARIKFEPADLVLYSKSQIHSVSVLTDDKATYATLTITSNKVDVVKNKRIDQAEGGRFTFDLTALNIRKLNNEELVVTIKTNGKIFVDQSTFVRGKSNQMSTDGSTWKEMSAFPPAISGSWIMSVNLNEGSEESNAPFPAIRLEASYSVGSKFIPALNNATSDVESVTYSVNGTTVTTDYTFAAAGVHTIIATIKHTPASGLGTETIVRKITVK